METQLIVGHATHDSVRVWVRGPGEAAIEVQARPGAPPPQLSTLPLSAETDFTGAVEIGALSPDTPHDVRVRFAGGELRTGQFRTFPRPGGPPADFSFVHASCNLSVPRVTKLVSLATAYAGSLAVERALDRPALSWLPPALRMRPDDGAVVRALRGKVNALRAAMLDSPRLRAVLRALLRRPAQITSKGLLALTGWLTRYEQDGSFLTSPFATILALWDRPDPPAFMIHAGDQIYADLDAPRPGPDVAEYRRAYRQAWTEDAELAALLSRSPHYMTLDDHEVINDFDERAEHRAYAEAGLRAYREYVACRNPQTEPGRLWYRFAHGRTQFFVLDTRTEREPGRMLHSEQQRALQSWMRDHRRDLKFVVSTLPFVAEVRAPEREGQADRRFDKWSGPRFREQRAEILEFIFEHAIERTIFLVGDMHCTYHASLRLRPRDERPPPERAQRRITVHELSGGPIHQVQFARRRRFYDHYRGLTPSCAFTSRIEAFHSATNCVLEVRVRGGGVDWRALPCRIRFGPRPHEGAATPRLGGAIRF